MNFPATLLTALDFCQRNVNIPEKFKYLYVFTIEESPLVFVFRFLQKYEV